MLEVQPNLDQMSVSYAQKMRGKEEKKGRGKEEKKRRKGGTNWGSNRKKKERKEVRAHLFRLRSRHLFLTNQKYAI